jgi:hypothetical protein
MQGLLRVERAHGLALAARELPAVGALGFEGEAGKLKLLCSHFDL